MPLMDWKVLDLSHSFSPFLWLSTYLPIYFPCIYLSIDLSIYLSLSLSSNYPIYRSIYRPIDLSTYRPIYLSTYLPIYSFIFSYLIFFSFLISLSIHLIVYIHKHTDNIQGGKQNVYNVPLFRWIKSPFVLVKAVFLMVHQFITSPPWASARGHCDAHPFGSRRSQGFLVSPGLGQTWSRDAGIFIGVQKFWFFWKLCCMFVVFMFHYIYI